MRFSIWWLLVNNSFYLRLSLFLLLFWRPPLLRLLFRLLLRSLFRRCPLLFLFRLLSLFFGFLGCNAFTDKPIRLRFYINRNNLSFNDIAYSQHIRWMLNGYCIIRCECKRPLVLRPKSTKAPKSTTLWTVPFTTVPTWISSRLTTCF